MKYFFILVFILRCDVSLGQDREAVQFTSQDRISILQEHNSIRSRVVPSASNMQPMMWSESLASAALDYSLLCDSSPFRNGNPVTVPGFASAGVTAGITGTRRANFVGLVIAFETQGQNYNYTLNRCTTTGACDYNWLVTRADTVLVGCGATICDRVTSFPVIGSTILYCYYSPTATPLALRAYLEGTPCTSCRENQTHCNTGLCAFCKFNTFYLAENSTCVEDCSPFHYADVTSGHCIPFAQNYTVVANMSSYSVTTISTSTAGTVNIPFTVTFQLNQYSETFFRPTGHILLTVNTSSDNGNAFHFDDNSKIRMYTSVNDSLQGLTILEHMGNEDTLVMRDVVFFTYAIPSPVVTPATSSFFVELYSGDCIGCEGPTVTTVDRTPLLQGSVTVIPPGVVTITAVSLSGLLCPGDIMSYRCVIESYSPELELTWRVTGPDRPPLALTYSSGSSANVSTSLDTHITAVFHGYDYSAGPDGLRSVQSVLMRAIPNNRTANEFQLECLFTDLSMASVQVRLHAPTLPLPPSGLRVIGRTDSMTDTSIDLAWDAPEGDGAESLVDHYILSISPPPLSAPMETVVPASPWSTVLISSIEVYTASVTAVNCNGNSAALTLNINLTLTLILLAVEDNSTLLCPGDTLSFHCAVISSVLDLQLVWQVTYPGQAPVTVTYNATAVSEANFTTSNGYLSMNIHSFLTAFELDDRMESVIVLTVPEYSLRTNPTIECAYMDSVPQLLLIAFDSPGLGLPSGPGNFRITGNYRNDTNITLILEWDAPLEEIDNYIISISPPPLSDPMESMVLASPWNVTLDITTDIYTASIVTVNCNGPSNPVYLTIDFTTYVTLLPHDHIAVIECPGDVVTYNCSIYSYGSTDLELTWRVSIPATTPIVITYSNSSSLNMALLLSMNITVTLTAFEEERYFIDSVIMLPVISGEHRREVQLECFSDDVYQAVAAFSDPVRPPPTRLRISNRHYDKDNVTLTLEWDAPQGDAVVDYYTISISPPPLSYLTQVFTSSSNITLNSSIGEYNASIVAVNCNGESIPLQMGIDAREGLSRSGESLQIYKLAIGLSAALTVVLALVISIAVITGGVWGKHHIRKEKKRKSLKLEGGTTSASNSYIERIS